MTNKLKKTLLISTLILLTSCNNGISEPPEALSVAPIWNDLRIVQFYGRYAKSGSKVEMSLPEARQAGLICTDAVSHAAYEAYVRYMKKLAEKRCK